MSQELLGELIREVRSTRPSRIALVWRDQEYSYLTLDSEIDRVAEGLLQRNVRQGDRIALYTHNLPQFVIAFYALQRLGAVVVPVNIYWRGRDLQHLLSESRVSGVVTIAPLYDRIAEIEDSLPDLKWVTVITGGAEQPPDTIAWDDLDSGPLTEPVYTEADAVDPAVIAFTGGRTGPSHPALLSHFNLLANCQQMQDLAQVTFLGDVEAEAARESAQYVPGANPQEIALLPLPLFNLFSLNIGMNLTYMLSGTVVLMERFDPAQALELIESRGCTVIYGSPAIFSEILKAPGFAEADLSSLRYAFSYGLPLEPEVNKAWQARTGKPIFNCYGVTEASPLLCCEAAGETIVPDSVGPALPMVQLAIMGPDGQPVEPNQVGELLAKGPNMMLGYFDPENPAEPIITRQDGWFGTGDLALYDANGNFRIIDRKEDTLLLPNGELLPPRDIEQVLNAHPGVWQSAALPHTASDGRNRMVAFVVLNDAGQTLTEPLLLHYCENRLPSHACPERIFVYRDDDLLRLPNGAVWRRALRVQVPNYL